MPPEVFTSRLQEALRSQAQPHLLPFLQKTLPALRAALQKGEVIIEGIDATASQHPPLPDMPQPTQWDTSTQRTNNENSYMSQRSSSVAPPSSLISSTGSYTRTEGSDEFSVEESSSEIEVRTLPSSQTQYKLLNGDVIARKIQRIMPDGGIPQDDVVALISQAAEFRLR
ncbi:hypothetical protein WUBG_17035, partial [Wuchereria bancrofti]